MLLVSCVLASCGGAAPIEGPRSPRTEGPQPAAERPPSDEPSGEPSDEPPPEVAEVDLLRSVRTDLAVSTVYRGQSFQVARLVDDDVATAWNSRSGELAGAWIEARIPASATVTAIALTAGFTHGSGSEDLFTGNHRIARVRVLRDGVEVATARLDPEVRELQRVPVEGGGGVYRIEIVEVVPGTRRDWREVCVSELRVLGRDPSAREGERFPRFAVGQLPGPRAEPGSHDRAAVARRHRQETAWIEREWTAYERRLVGWDSASAADDDAPRERAELARARQAMLLRAAELVDLVDEVRADALRRAAFTPLGWDAYAVAIDEERARAVRADLDLVSDAMGAVTTWLGDDAARCRWARADIGLRLARIASQLMSRQTMVETAESHDECCTPEQARTRRTIYEDREWFEDTAAQWRTDPRAAAAALRRRRSFPEIDVLTPDWDAVRAQLEILRTDCGS